MHSHFYKVKNMSNETVPIKRDRLVYFGVPKNAWSTHQTFFRETGWEMSSWHEIFKEAPVYQWSFFGHIQNPHTRHTKGIAEHIYRLWDWRSKSQGYKKSPEIIFAEVEKWIKDEANGFAVSLMVQSVYDHHTIPIKNLCEDVGIDPYSVAWIPMDHPEFTTEELTNKFLASHNISERISENDRRHVADESKKGIYDVLHDMKFYSLMQTLNPFGGGQHYEKHFMPTVMKYDLELYAKVMKDHGVDVYEFEDPTWQDRVDKQGAYISEQFNEMYKR